MLIVYFGYVLYEFKNTGRSIEWFYCVCDDIWIFLNTVEWRYNAVQYYIIWNTSLHWLRRGKNQTLNPQNEMYSARISNKVDCVITAPHCIMSYLLHPMLIHITENAISIRRKRHLLLLIKHVLRESLRIWSVYPWPGGVCFFLISLRWRQNECEDVSNHQPHDCVLNRLFRRRSKKTSKLRVTGLCAGNSPGTGELPAQMASNAEKVSVSGRHHVVFASGLVVPDVYFVVLTIEYFKHDWSSISQHIGQPRKRKFVPSYHIANFNLWGKVLCWYGYLLIVSTYEE